VVEGLVPRALQSRRNLTLILVLVLAFMLALTGLNADAAPVRSLLLGESLDGIQLLPYLQVLEDPSRILSLDEVAHEPWSSRFQSATRRVLGASASAWWVRLGIDNPTDQRIPWMLESLHTLFNHIDLYWIDSEKQPHLVRMGNLQPFSERPVKSERFVFPLVTDPHVSRDLFIRIVYEKAGMVDFSMVAWNPDAYWLHSVEIAKLGGGLLGAVLVAMLFYLLIYSSVRLPAFVWYLPYWISAVLSYLNITGLGKRYLWPDSPLLSDGAFFFFGFLTFFFAIQFSRGFLETRRTLPGFDRILLGVHGINGLSLIAYAVGERGIAVNSSFLTGLGLLLLPFMGWRAWMRGQREARFFVLAWSAWSFCLMIALLRVSGVFITTEWTLWGARIGYVLESILLSFALIDQISILRRQKLHAEKQSLQLLEQANADLESKVAERTLELEKARQVAEALAQTDGLTGIANRRRFDDILASEWKRGLRSGKPLAVAMIDVDYFKKYNDHHGHQAGDECLRKLSRILETQTRRTSDIAARYGGEEFVLIAPETPFANMRMLAENVRAALESLALSHETSPLGRVTMSVGVAATQGDVVTASVLVASADRALHLARKQARERLRATPSSRPRP
ncbi:MAG: diguanylate cyclase, partial [Pseudomonadota bacterium]